MSGSSEKFRRVDFALGVACCASKNHHAQFLPTVPVRIVGASKRLIAETFQHGYYPILEKIRRSDVSSYREEGDDLIDAPGTTLTYYFQVLAVFSRELIISDTRQYRTRGIFPSENRNLRAGQVIALEASPHSYCFSVRPVTCGELFPDATCIPLKGMAPDLLYTECLPVLGRPRLWGLAALTTPRPPPSFGEPACPQDGPAPDEAEQGDEPPPPTHGAARVAFLRGLPFMDDSLLEALQSREEADLEADLEALTQADDAHYDQMRLHGAYMSAVQRRDHFTRPVALALLLEDPRLTLLEQLAVLSGYCDHLRYIEDTISILPPIMPYEQVSSSVLAAPLDACPVFPTPAPPAAWPSPAMLCSLHTDAPGTEADLAAAYLVSWRLCIQTLPTLVATHAHFAGLFAKHRSRSVRLATLLGRGLAWSLQAILRLAGVNMGQDLRQPISLQRDVFPVLPLLDVDTCQSLLDVLADLLLGRKGLSMLRCAPDERRALLAGGAYRDFFSALLGLVGSATRDEGRLGQELDRLGGPMLLGDLCDLSNPVPPAALAEAKRPRYIGDLTIPPLPADERAALSRQLHFARTLRYSAALMALELWTLPVLQAAFLGTCHPTWCTARGFPYNCAQPDGTSAPSSTSREEESLLARFEAFLFGEAARLGDPQLTSWATLEELAFPQHRVAARLGACLQSISGCDHPEGVQVGVQACPETSLILEPLDLRALLADHRRHLVRGLECPPTPAAIATSSGSWCPLDPESSGHSLGRAWTVIFERARDEERRCAACETRIEEEIKATRAQLISMEEAAKAAQLSVRAAQEAEIARLMAEVKTIEPQRRGEYMKMVQAKKKAAAVKPLAPTLRDHQAFMRNYCPARISPAEFFQCMPRGPDDTAERGLVERRPQPPLDDFWVSRLELVVAQRHCQDILHDVPPTDPSLLCPCTHADATRVLGTLSAYFRTMYTPRELEALARHCDALDPAREPTGVMLRETLTALGLVGTR
ncbi:hypothetical protein PAPYR_5884 [Paratrimastix pyriformis]|uniref:Uncharacterized protein n=1 Tax=Paratrimastix pyriformis TaxID=342808 RepID=A0ABQ8UK67_9EUKA|nr:hypothetical protein PAPYR_5884 [Paratrimastix pyriformis]